MRLFLTSSMGEHYNEGGKYYPQPILEVNNWRETLRNEIGHMTRGLLIAALPDEYEMNDSMKDDMEKSFVMTGFEPKDMAVCDNRNWESIQELMDKTEFIILSGGHVPTQNEFFNKIGLKDRIKSFDGIVIGISAGTMNCADIVYACPEEEGESLDENYKRYIPGLSLTKINVLPHYQYLCEVMLDGVRMIEDIALKDSYNKSFIALVDGSYISVIDGKSVIYGEAYRAYNGKIEKICDVDNTLELNGEEL